MKAPISFVYFDVGGVALLDFSATDGWNNLLTHWHINSKNNSLFDKVWTKYSNRLCVDPSSIEEISSELLQLPGFISADQFDFVRDFVDRFELNPSIEPIMEQLNTNKTPFGLLTNMYPTMFETIIEKKLLPRFNYATIIDSSREFCEKPNRPIYLKAQDLCGFSGDQILFVDNVEKNLFPARELGWQTFLYDSKNPRESSDLLYHFIFSR